MSSVVSFINTIFLYHFIANTNSVHKRHINKKVMEFVKDKPKGTNPAIIGNPIAMSAVNGSKKQSILLLQKPNLNEENHAQCKKQNKKQTTCSLSKEFIVCDLINIIILPPKDDKNFMPRHL